MTETTTIQITKSQALALAERKEYDDESYKSVIGRLLRDDNSAIDADDVADQVAERVEKRIDDLEAQLPRKVSEELR